MALAAGLAGCSAGSVIDKLPGSMGEPGDTPVRPTAAYQYPAVHDMPPSRADQPLTDEQQVQMEKDLEKVRDRQLGQQPDSSASSSAKSGKSGVQTGKEQPAEANETGATGGKPNP